MRRLLTDARGGGGGARTLERPGYACRRYSDSTSRCFDSCRRYSGGAHDSDATASAFFPAFRWAVAFFLAALFAPAALAQETETQATGGGGVELLRGFLEKTPAARITLSRRTVDSEGNQADAGQARLYLLRPDKFRLEHHGAEELLIVSDGETVWTYEPDLSQAIRRPYSQARRMGALAMLAGDAPESYFQLSAAALPDAAGLRWISARPRADSESAAETTIIRAGFSPGGELAGIELRDALGGVVEMSVVGISREAPPESLFQFIPPPGTDVVSEDG